MEMRRDRKLLKQILAKRKREAEKKGRKILINAENLSCPNPKLHGNGIGARGDGSYIRGDITGVIGNVSEYSGDITGIVGNVNRGSGNMTGIEGDMTGIACDSETIRRILRQLRLRDQGNGK